MLLCLYKLNMGLRQKQKLSMLTLYRTCLTYLSCVNYSLTRKLNYQRKWKKTVLFLNFPFRLFITALTSKIYDKRKQRNRIPFVVCFLIHHQWFCALRGSSVSSTSPSWIAEIAISRNRTDLYIIPISFPPYHLLRTECSGMVTW